MRPCLGCQVGLWSTAAPGGSGGDGAGCGAVKAAAVVVIAAASRTETGEARMPPSDGRLEHAVAAAIPAITATRSWNSSVGLSLGCDMVASFIVNELGVCRLGSTSVRAPSSRRALILTGPLLAGNPFRDRGPARL